MREVGWGVEVDSEQRIAAHGNAQAEVDGLFEMPTERPWTVCEPKAGVGRERGHVGAVAARVGHQGDRSLHCDCSQGDRAWQVAVGHHHMLDVPFTQSVDASVHGGIESHTWVPEHGCTVRHRPLGHRRMVAGHEDRKLTRRGEHSFGGPPGQCFSFVGCQRSRQACLGIGERFHRYEHDGFHTGIVEGVAYAVAMPINVAVIGAGSWGTTVAALAAGNAPTMLWARRPALADIINTEHVNTDYLPQFALPEQLRATPSLAEAVSNADVLVMAVPSHGYREVVAEAAPYLRPWVPIVSLTKGLERTTSKRMSEVTRDEMPGHPVAVLTGPNLAKEVLAGQPAASVVAIDDHDIAAELQRIFARPSLRIYTNGDVVGCEVGGVVKNVIAIAAGMAEGMGFGDNTRATLITRGLAEMTRLGTAMGGQAATFAGLAGMGDLIATCSSKQSRNNMVGVRLGEGRSIEEVLADMNMVAEGVKSSPSVLDLAHRHGVEMPITEQVVAVCHGGRSAREALGALMQRTRKSEME